MARHGAALRPRRWLRAAAAAAAATVGIATTAGEEEVCLGATECLQTARRSRDGAAAAAVADPDASGLAMLQLSAGGQRVRSGQLAGSSPVPEQVVFKGVRMLYVQLPMSDELRQITDVRPLFGMDRDGDHGGIRLDPEGTAQLMIAHYPDAPISWEGEPGKSPALNLPHHSLRVQLPLERQDRRFVQSSYALVNDDRAMMIQRLGYGIPAKLANITFPAPDASLDGSPTISIDRRGATLFEATGLRDAGEASAEEVEELFGHADLTWGTPVSNYLEGMGWTNISFFQHATKATVRTARKVDVTLTMPPEQYDPLAFLFKDTRPIKAFWVEADLEVTTKFDSFMEQPLPKEDKAADKSEKPKAPDQPNIIALRVGGAVTAPPELTVTLRSKSCANADVVWARMKLNPEKVAPYLPPGFKLRLDHGVLFHQRCQPGAFKLLGPSMQMPLEYNELWVEVFGEIDGDAVTVPLILLVDDDIAAMAGHDYGGTPKKMANLTFTVTPGAGEGSDIFLDINRHGRQVMKLTARIGEPDKDRVLGVTDHSKESIGYSWIMAHQFPREGEMDRPFMFFPSSLTDTTDQHSITDLAVELGNSPQEPFGEWFVGQPIGGGYARQSRDWGPNLVKDNFQKLPGDGWVAWWARSFQLFHM